MALDLISIIIGANSTFWRNSLIFILRCVNQSISAIWAFNCFVHGDNLPFNLKWNILLHTAKHSEIRRGIQIVINYAFRKI